VVWVGQGRGRIHPSLANISAKRSSLSIPLQKFINPHLYQFDFTKFSIDTLVEQNGPAPSTPTRQPECIPLNGKNIIFGGFCRPKKSNSIMMFGFSADINNEENPIGSERQGKKDRCSTTRAPLLYIYTHYWGWLFS